MWLILLSIFFKPGWLMPADMPIQAQCSARWFNWHQGLLRTRFPTLSLSVSSLTLADSRVRIRSRSAQCRTNIFHCRRMFYRGRKPNTALRRAYAGPGASGIADLASGSSPSSNLSIRKFGFGHLRVTAGPLHQQYRNQITLCYQ